MTTLEITPRISDKTARFKGAVAAGEHVAVTIKGGAEWLGDDAGANLTLRVLDLVTGRTLAVFPRPDETYGEDEEYVPDEWSTSAEDPNDLFCNLNLNTDRMVNAARHMLRVPVLFVLGDTDAPRTLYFRDRYEVDYWPERIGDTVPYDLDKWPKQIDEWTDLVATWTSRMNNLALDAERVDGGVKITLNDGTLETPKEVVVNDGEVLRNEMNAAIAAMGATKQNKLTFDAIPMEGSDNPVKSGGVHGAVKEVADAVAEHTANTDIHVTAAQKTAWTAKYDKPNGGIPKSDLAQAVKDSLGKADTAVQVHQSLDAYVNAAGYDSTAKEIQLKHDSTVVARIDATAFIKDGMVDSVEITGGNLVISFNTDAGVEDIEIPLTDIFNPSNYYDKTAADNRFVQKETGKGLVAVDAALSPTSENPVQNKAVAAALAGKLDGAAAYPAWDSTAYYLQGSVVSYGGRLWKAKRDIPHPPPDAHEPPPDYDDAPWDEVFLKDLKQDALSSPQLAAVNSGATAAKVATWDGYAAQIAQKASLADLPYAMVTPGEWEFSDGVAHVIYGPSQSPDGWYYSFSDQEYVGYMSQYFSDEDEALNALVLNFFNGINAITATRPSLPGHLLDRAGNLVEVSGDTTLTLPAAAPGYLRDFLVRLEISGSTVPTITFSAPAGEMLTYETDGDEFPVPDEAGDWLYSFTETAAHTFAVALKKVNEVAAPQAQGGA